MKSSYLRRDVLFSFTDELDDLHRIQSHFLLSPNSNTISSLVQSGLPFGQLIINHLKMANRYQSEETVDPAPLGKVLAFEFSGRVAKNRFMKASMAEGLASWHPTKLDARGIPTPELIELYKR